MGVEESIESVKALRIGDTGRCKDRIKHTSKICSHHVLALPLL